MQTEQRVQTEWGTDTREPSRVVVPVEGTPLSASEAEVAGAVSRGGTTLVTELATVGPGESLTVPDEEFGRHREIVRESVAAAEQAAGETEGMVGVGRRRARIVGDVAASHDAETILAGLADRPDGDGSDHRLVDELRSASDCRVVYARNATQLADVSSLLVPIEDGPHMAATVAVADALASAFDACLELLHVTEPDPSPERRRRGEQVLSQATEPLAADGDWETWLLAADRVADTIVQQAGYYDATVLGGPRRDRLQRFVFGSTASAVREGAAGPAFTVWRGTPDSPRDAPTL